MKIAVKATDVNNNTTIEYFTILKAPNKFAFNNNVNKTTLGPGETEYTIYGIISTDIGLERAICKTVSDTSELILEDDTIFPDPKNYSFAFRITNVTEDKYIIIEYTDKINTKDSLRFSIYKVSGPINTWTKTLGSQNNTRGSALSVSTAKVYPMIETMANTDSIDLVYYYDPVNSATFAAPDDSNAELIFSSLGSWDKRNATKFKSSSITGVEFDGMTNDAYIPGAAISGDLTSISSLTTSTVVAFTTEKGKKGLIKINEIIPGDTGNITITVKVQK